MALSVADVLRCSYRFYWSKLILNIETIVLYDVTIYVVVVVVVIIIIIYIYSVLTCRINSTGAQTI
jgi:hypothetical protein